MRGLAARDVLSGIRTEATARVVDHAGTDQYDLVLVTVRFGQIARAAGQLAALGGTPAVLFFGNNPPGRARNAPAEMKALAGQVTARLAGSPGTRHLRQLLAVEGQQHC